MTLNLKSKCECLSYELALQIREQLNAASKLTEEKTLKRKIAHLTKAVEALAKAREKHERDRVEYMQSVVEFVKKGEINAHRAMKTVPWEK